MADSISKMKVTKPEGQSDEVFNLFKSFLDNLAHLSDTQLAMINYEAWHEAYVRADKEKLKEIIGNE
jgi:hypothetical protein